MRPGNATQTYMVFDSTPIKILVFVLVDGWRLISESVVTSFLVGG